MSLYFTSVPPKSLSTAILSTATTFRINNIEGWDGNDLTSSDFGSQAFGAFLSKDRTVLEIFEWDPTTIANTSITFIGRGLVFTGINTTPVAANQIDWAAGTTVLLGTDVPQIWQWLKDYIDGIAIAGSPDASTTIKGIAEEATQAEVDAGTASGGTSARLFINPSTHRGRLYNDYSVDTVGTDDYAITPVPTITAYTAGQVFTFKAGAANTGSATLNVAGLGAKTIKKGGPSTIGGDSTTQFDITNTSGTTYRYTYDGTGTNPNISSTTIPTGAKLVINGQNFTAANNGTFTVTGSGSNYFEVTNASGVAESNKTLGTGYINNTLSDLATGDIALNQIVIAQYDGTYMQMISNIAPVTPIVRTYTASATVGSSTTQFDITNPTGTTFRYTWDGTGTDPVISAITVPIGMKIYIYSSNMAAANTTSSTPFTVTASGTNYFEVTNASGVAEVNKTLGSTGYLILGQTWTKPAGLKYITAEIVGGGGGGEGGTVYSGAGATAGGGGGGGGYSKKLIAASSLGLTETITIGIGGLGVLAGVAPAFTGGATYFGSFISATGGGGGSAENGGSGGIGSGGDINIYGGGAGAGVIDSGSSHADSRVGGNGGSSFFGGGGKGQENTKAAQSGGLYGGGGAGCSATQAGGNGANGVVVVTEYY